jgi:hypothetical protein
MIGSRSLDADAMMEVHVILGLNHASAITAYSIVKEKKLCSCFQPTAGNQNVQTTRKLH